MTRYVPLLTPVVFAIGAVIAGGCAHSTQSLRTETVDASWANSSIEIEYKMNHADRKLLLVSDQQGIHARSIVDGSALKQCQVDSLHYNEFLAKTRAFIESRRAPASTNCRAPYKIILKNQKDTFETQGCRVSDEGAFSHLVQEGEFLLYRQK